MGYLRPKLQRLEAWLEESREITNYTYDLEVINVAYLGAFLAQVTGRPVEQCAGFIEEVRGDGELAEHIAKTTRGHARREISDETARYGRRMGWYALVRLLKPKLVVETGVDKGLGACVLCAALRRNAADGHTGGRYVGTDLYEATGWLLTPPYREFGQVVYGDSLATLSRLNAPIDLFINDSNHDPVYEAREYEAIAAKLAPGAIIVGDNAH